jgi:Sec-independent protein translocase protein TatA
MIGLILLALLCIVLIKPTDLPRICYTVGRIFKKTQQIIEKLKRDFWTLYDIGEVQFNQKNNHGSSNKSDKDSSAK